MVKINFKVILMRLAMLLAILLMSKLFCQAQEIRSDRTTERAMTGEPIFSHGMYYTGMVEYDGEMIPIFLFADYYVFGNLVFKNERQAKKYYKRRKKCRK